MFLDSAIDSQVNFTVFLNDSPQTQRSVLQNRQQQGNQMLLTSLPLVHYGQIYGKLLANL